MRKRPASLGKHQTGIPAAAAGLTPAARAVVVRLLSVVTANGAVLPEEMLDEIEAISIDGVDPQWQIDEMRKILDRWMAQH